MNDSAILELVIETINELDREESIDWGMLNTDEDSAIRMMATSVVEYYGEMSNYNIVMLATVTKLIVENFILNIRLFQK